MTLEISSISSEHTEQLGEALGRNLKGGETIELTSDLGGGKTTLTRGIVRGAGSKDVVASPTFTISKLYDALKFAIHHFDFYRLSDAGIVAHELSEAAHDSQDVVIVEWGDVVQDVLPEERLKVHIRRTGNDSRTLTIQCPERLAYLLEGITA